MYLRRHLRPSWWLAALALTLLGGCAGKPRPVVFTPSAHAEPADTPQEEQLKQLPLAELLARGDQYLARDNLQLARLYYRQALSRQPASSAARVGVGRILLRQHHSQAAAATFSQVLEQEPDNLAALAALGRIHRLRGDYHRAADELVRALRLNPQNPELLTELAHTSAATGATEAAAVWYRQVLQLQPDNPAAYNNLGVNQLLQQRYPQAIAAFRQALALAPQETRIRNNLAAACLLDGRDSEGLTLFRQAVGGPAAYNNIGYLYLVQQKWDQAEAAFNKALELSPNYYVRAADNLQLLQALHADEQPSANPVE